MKKLTIIVAILTPLSFTVSAENNFSAELLLGSANQKSNFYDEEGDAFKIKEDDLSVAIRGAYQFHKNLAVEASYIHFGEVDFNESGEDFSSSASVKSAAINAGLKGILPLNHGFSLNARIGVSFWNTENKLSWNEIDDGDVHAGSVTADDSGVSAYYGVGAQYDINKNLFVGIEYSYTNMDSSVTMLVNEEDGEDKFDIDNKVSNLSLSLGYKF